MKKSIVFLFFAIVATTAFARMAQFIVTDCGTVHSIPANSTEAEACRMVDFWSMVDC